MDRSPKEMHVLLVEDSAWTRDSIAEIVKGVVGLATQLKIVESEAAAVESIAATPPDVVILDLLLQQGSGFGVLRKLEKHKESAPKPKIVVLTNYALPQYREMALLLGADYFLDKALCMENLPPIIESIAKGSNPPHAAPGAERT